MPILTGDDVKKAKPSPDIFLAAAQSLKIQLRDCIVVGDSVWDVWLLGVKVRWASECFREDMGKKNCIVPERLGFTQILKDMLLHLEQLGLPGQSVN